MQCKNLPQYYEEAGGDGTPLLLVPRLALKVDRPHYTAGDTVSGRIYLGSPPSAPHYSLRLKLHGYERTTRIGQQSTTTAHEFDRCHHKDHDNTSTTDLSEQTKTLVHTEYLPTTIPLPKPSDSHCWQYPFSFQLSNALAGSLFCLSEKDATRLTYSLTASVVNDTAKSSIATATTILHIQAASPPTTPDESTPCLVHPQVFGGTWCWPFFTKSNTIRLGWETDDSVYAKGDVVHVHVTMDYAASMPVTAVKVSCIETVTVQRRHGSFTTATTGYSHQTTTSSSRVVAESNVPATTWKSRDYDEDEPKLVLLRKVTADLRIPASVRDSYQGELVQVSHSLQVTVETAPKNKKRSPVEAAQAVAPIRIVPRSVKKMTTNESEATDATEDSTVVVTPTKEAQWQPVVVPPCTGATTKDKTDDATTCPEASLPTSCSDNLAFLLAAAECDDGWKCSEPCRRQQVQLLLQRHPEQLTDLLQDAAWACTLQNASPCDLAMYVSSVPTTAAQVDTAVTLAVTIGDQFTVMHVLAMVRHLNVDTGMEVLRQTIGLAVDLSDQRLWLESQLDEKELRHLRSALLGPAR